MTRSILALGAACALALAAPAAAGNGHLLHGVGAINSSMGGVSTAVASDAIGALHVNPALLTQFDGYEVGFGAEIFTDGPEATATFVDSPGRPNGSFTTEGDTEPGIVPAFGMVVHPAGKPWAFGFGLLGVAGFRTDWPQDPNNPIFAPQPDGFGAVKTDLSIVKIPFTLAYQVNPQLSLGGSLVVYRGGLSISPLPPAEPNCTNPTPGSGREVDCFYAPAENIVSAYAVALQVGLHYEVNPVWSVGFSYTTPQDFNDYEWSSFNALPYNTDPVTGAQTRNPGFGEARTVNYPLDGPQIVSAGIGYRPGPKLKVGLDARWVGYSSVDGAGGVGGFKPNRSLNEIGWRDIYIGAVGLEYKSSPKVTWRAGFNYSQTPIRDEVAFTSLGTPPTFTDHYTLGLGIALTDKLQVNLGGYWAPRHEVSGPLLSAFLPTGGPGGPQTLAEQRVPGGTFTISEEIKSLLTAFTFRF
jgi:long-chain fatty acid transport protein